MSKQPNKKSSPLAKVRSKEVIHMDYFDVYHGVLKFEEVLDHDIDEILEAVKTVLSRKQRKVKLVAPPSESEIETLIKEVLDQVCKK